MQIHVCFALYRMPPINTTWPTTSANITSLSGLLKWQQHAKDAARSGGCVIKPVPALSDMQKAEIEISAGVVLEVVHVSVSEGTREEDVADRLQPNVFGGRGKHFALSTRFTNMVGPSTVVKNAIESKGHTCYNPNTDQVGDQSGQLYSQEQ